VRDADNSHRQNLLVGLFWLDSPRPGDYVRAMSNDGGNGGFDPDDIGKKAGEVAKKNGGWIVLILLLLGISLTTYYQVEPDEVGIVTQFGRFVRTEPPGPHFRLPFGIEKVRKVPVQRQLKLEFGFRTTSPGVNSQKINTAETASEALMLTGDLNVATVEWVVQYKIDDPYKYVFRVRNVTDTLRDISEAAMREVVGDRSVTEVLTIGRAEIQLAAKERLQELAEKYDIGVKILQLVLQNVNPPAAVKDAFNEVNRSQQEQDRAINQANAQYNKIIPEARGKALQAIEASRGYATERINTAKGDVAKFVALQQEYAKSPRVTRTRIYLETMSEVLPRAGKRVFLDENLKGLMPLLPLGKVK